MHQTSLPGLQKGIIGLTVVLSIFIGSFFLTQTTHAATTQTPEEKIQSLVGPIKTVQTMYVTCVNKPCPTNVTALVKNLLIDLLKDLLGAYQALLKEQSQTSDGSSSHSGSGSGSSSSHTQTGSLTSSLNIAAKTATAFSGTAKNVSTITIHIAYPGGGSATHSGIPVTNDTWTLAYPVGLDAGTYTLTIRADSATGRILSTATLTVVAPGKTGSITSSLAVPAHTVMDISGTAANVSIVAVHVAYPGGTSATHSSIPVTNGTWNVHYASGLDAGSYVLTLHADTPTGTILNTKTLVVTDAAPTAVITTASLKAGSLPAIRGTVTGIDTVNVLVQYPSQAGSGYGISQSDDRLVASGAWSMKLLNPIVVGDYLITVRANSITGATLATKSISVKGPYPTASVTTANLISTSSARMRGFVNAQNLSGVSSLFRYGAGAATCAGGVSDTLIDTNPNTISGWASTTVVRFVKNLTPDTTYYYCIESSSGGGSVGAPLSNIQSFKTSSL